MFRAKRRLATLVSAALLFTFCIHAPTASRASNPCPNTDAFNVTYQRGADIYINRACGFRTSFTDIDPTIQAEGSANWMLVSSVNNTTVENEDITHITIFH